MTAYYNEIDPYAAAWLRNLVAAGRIAAGDVDERSIRDVKPDDLKAYTQCHFFAGIGVWSAALRLAGWADDRPVWTGSCPCQPFSAAGKGGGFDDERHLWPDLFRLIAECKPGVVFGEQVASKDGLAWLDLVQADLEGADYASGAVDLCAAGVGAPHIRQRLYWVAEGLDDAASTRRFGKIKDAEGNPRDEARLRLLGEGRGSGGLADAAHQQQHGSRDAGSSGRDEHSDGVAAIGLADASGERRDGQQVFLQSGEPRQAGAETTRDSGPSRLADANGGDTSAEREQRSGEQRQQSEDSGAGSVADADDARLSVRECPAVERAGWRDEGRAAEQPSGAYAGGESAARPTNGQWRDADWIFCRDGKWRPVEPGTFPLVDGATSRVGRLRAYGNAIVAPLAAQFIGAVMECRP